MYPVLIVREEIICLIFLVFLIMNAKFYKMGKDNGNFYRLSLFALGHVVFDIVTILTVNRLDSVAPWLNAVFHVIFYLMAVMFSYEFFGYVIYIGYSKNVTKRIRWLALIPIIVYVAILPFLDIGYTHGNGTNYSSGPAVILGYGISFIYFLCSFLVLIIKNGKIQKHVRVSLYPMLGILIAAEIMQIILPELLFTGGAVTIVTVGFFFSLENPAEVFKRKLQIDALTGVKSRHCYEEDIKAIEAGSAFSDRNEYCLVFCDINGLKSVNDIHGHALGDTYISVVAQILLCEMKNAENIYRMGGDEFLAIYHNKSESLVLREIDEVQRACRERSEEYPFLISIATGHAMSGTEYTSIRDVLRMADYLMYRNKAEMKRAKAYRSISHHDEINMAGLMDRMFDILAENSDRNYVFMCNMETNVSRFSQSMVEYFDLPGEFIYDFTTLWKTYIHPDDQDEFISDISAVFEKRRTSHNAEYRVRNSQGKYVVVTCRGSVVNGKNGEPDIFGGIITNHGIIETIDPLTGLENDFCMEAYGRKIIERGWMAAYMRLTILSFERVNMLYGYSRGNDVLCQFASQLRHIVGDRGRVFRMGSMEFSICFLNGRKDEIVETYRQIQNMASSNIHMNQLLIPLKTACGAFIKDKTFAGNENTIRSSLIYALEDSKFKQNGNLVIYNDPAETIDDRDYRLLTSVHQDAIAQMTGFFMRYQPIVRMDTGKIIGAEALMRWQDDYYGEVSPGRFIPWLENDPCFFELGKRILSQALTDAKKALKYLPDFILNVNVTIQQLQDPKFRSVVTSALEAAGYPAKQLCLELTERCREMKLEQLRREILFFRSIGVRVALDDVGTGSAALNLMLNLPVDEIKLDISMIREVDQKPINQTYVRLMVDAAVSSKFMVCFEGVENQKVYDYLNQYPNATYQGYYCSKPLLVGDLIELIRDRQKSAEEKPET